MINRYLTNIYLGHLRVRVRVRFRVRDQVLTLFIPEANPLSSSFVPEVNPLYSSFVPETNPLYSYRSEHEYFIKEKGFGSSLHRFIASSVHRFIASWTKRNERKRKKRTRFFSPQLASLTRKGRNEIKWNSIFIRVASPSKGFASLLFSSPFAITMNS